MSIESEAIDRIEQAKKTLNANMRSHETDYMAHLGALVECNLLIDQYKEEYNREMVLHHNMMRAIIEKKFISYCLKNGYKYLKSN